MITRRGFVPVFVLGMALAVVIAGVWLSQPSLFEDSLVGVGLVHAQPSMTSCGACHANPITVVDSTGCTDCHDGVEAILPPTAVAGNTRYFLEHHNAQPVPPPGSRGCTAVDCHDGITLPPVSAEPSCQNTSCHNTSDARYVVRPLLDGKQKTGHDYCKLCHDTSDHTAFDFHGTGQGCKDFCHIP